MFTRRTDRLIFLMLAMVCAVCLWRQSSSVPGKPWMDVSADGGDAASVSKGAKSGHSSGPAYVSITLTTKKTGPFSYVVCAHVLSSGSPYKDMVVDFSVPSGPHKDRHFTGKTDRNGDVCWTFEGDGRFGTDTVEGNSEGAIDTTTFNWYSTTELRFMSGSRGGCS